ncbi:pantetheine-phosphate adenylyltransferase [Companilactobacillus metriopterae]|uniref:pantetheine-phosphate adenylyltransferase n=1 Tax=Companilactobacillus metriopterae TaxID=1909267 RepID=UPI00100AC626|nr:pantetheine-phosphate adenylyltransferase [Companilactobacillus metriopterae]
MTDKIAIYAGSFDPVTNGHIEIIKRSAKMFDKLIVATMTNTSKKYMFSYEEKKSFIQDEIKNISNVEVVDGKSQLTTELAKEYKAQFLVRSMRNSDDFGYESGISSVNKILDPDIETVFLIADQKYANISSSMIKEVALFGADISELVPTKVAEQIKIKLGDKTNEI